MNALLGVPGHEAAAALVAEAAAAPAPPAPSWAGAVPPRDTDSDAFDRFVDANVRWNDELIESLYRQMYDGGLREKMALFWHGHFVTEHETYFFAPLAYRYTALLRRHALGDFRQFVFDVGLDPAMLIYLNGDLNTREEPNENYARELLELFTMGQFDAAGQPNYTEQDVREVARALTGHGVDFFAFDHRFDMNRHDTGDKTIFGRTSRFRYGDVIDLIFEERAEQTAVFVAGALCAAFVYAAPDAAFVESVAQVLLAHDFALAPAVEAVLASEHFFDEAVLGAQIKSPIELFVGLLRETHAERTRADLFRDLHWMAWETEQGLLQPPNVAGWPGYRSWISTSTLPVRWELVDYLLYDGILGGQFFSFVPLAERLHDPADPHAAFHLPVKLAEHLLPVPAEALSLDAPAEGFAGDLVSFPIPQEIADGPAHVRALAKRFLGGVPWYEWDVHHAGAPWLLFNYALALVRLPEYQLT